MNSNVLTEQRVVELGPVKKELKQTLMQLQSAEQTEQIRSAMALLERTIVDLNDLCNPTMVIPIAPR
jgi:hypothetical protein